jgi:hypothetical protein
MSLSNSRLSYSDCFDLLDRALDEPRGIRAEVPSMNAAVYLRMRIHHARTIDRAENKVTYPDPDHPHHGRSPYDVLVIRLEDGDPSAWVYIDKQIVEIGRIEAIPEDYQIEFRPTLMIEGPKVEIESVLPALAPTIRRR